MRPRAGSSGSPPVWPCATPRPLRGYPADLIDWLIAVPCDRFEYEMTVLLRAHAAHRPIVEVPIATVYLDGNRGTHFRPLADSARVYAPLLRFVGSSMLAAVIDVVGVLLLMWLTGSLLLSVVGARLASASVNFTVNRRLVFGSDSPVGRAATPYPALATALVAANYALMWSLTGVGLGLLLAKVITEAILYLTSFAVQNRVVFRHRATGQPMSRRNVVNLPMTTSRSA
jgi:putative flippase GtrA